VAAEKRIINDVTEVRKRQLTSKTKWCI